jgi:hypothetical protein
MLTSFEENIAAGLIARPKDCVPPTGVQSIEENVGESNAVQSLPRVDEGNTYSPPVCIGCMGTVSSFFS